MPKYFIVACVVAAAVTGGVLGVVGANHEWSVRESVDVVVWVDAENPGAFRLSTKSEGGPWVTHDETLQLREPSPARRWRRTDAVTVTLDFPQGAMSGHEHACLYASRIVEAQDGHEVDGCYAIGRSQHYYVRGTVNVVDAGSFRHSWEMCVWTSHFTRYSRAGYESTVSGPDWGEGVWHTGPVIGTGGIDELADVQCPGGPMYVDGVEATPEEIQAMQEALAP